jgi:5'-AMP-activated protein kinase catalytic alpha subunit
MIKDKKDVERITRELRILKKVRHPNIVMLYEVSGRM